MVTYFLSNGDDFHGVVNGKTFTGKFSNGVVVIDSPSDLTLDEFNAIVAFLG